MVAPFIYQMAEAYALADIVVSRAGATTLAELTALGKPAILVPYPHAAGHQQFNAKKILDAGGCRMLEDKGLSGETLAAEIIRLVESEEIREEMRKDSRALGRPDAARKAVDIAMSLGNKGI
jgi:UDP-N-acetylglucosamine--N-acetylmuramyl-(pentapeptide) pyrophosphoryl-undecaprenol N-acetylglucosamine transferase